MRNQWSSHALLGLEFGSLDHKKEKEMNFKKNYFKMVEKFQMPLERNVQSIYI
jgi:hypothetical protein